MVKPSGTPVLHQHQAMLQRGVVYPNCSEVPMVKLTIHSAGTGTCLLTGKDSADGIVVTFDDGTVKESFLSWRGFRQLLGLKAGKDGKIDPRPTPANPVVGQPVVQAK